MNWSDYTPPEPWELVEERRETFASMAAVLYALATCLALGLALVALLVLGMH